MRMRGLTLVLFLSGCTTAAPWNADRALIAIRAWELQSDPEPLSHITPQPMDKDFDLVAAICDHLQEWSGFFGVYHLSGDRVDWQARVDHEPWEQSIRSLRAVRLNGFSKPLLEVTGISHMGNGKLYLYE